MAELSEFERRAVEIARDESNKPGDIDQNTRIWFAFGIDEDSLPPDCDNERGRVGFALGWLRGREDGLREAAQAAAATCDTVREAPRG